MSSKDDEEDTLPPLDWAGARLPDGTRAHELEVGGETLLVLSYPIDEPDLPAQTLSPSEAEVALLAIRGLSNAQIAAHRGTSVRTVANQMASVLRKLELASRRELASRYARGALDS